MPISSSGWSTPIRKCPDYDDWALNGDILVWNEVLECAFELSSMGIRVDADSLKTQLELDGKTERLAFDYHKETIGYFY